MKFLYYFKIVTNNIARDIKKYVLLILSLIITSVLLSLTIYMMHENEFDQRMADKCFTSSSKHIGYLDIQYEESDNENVDAEKLKSESYNLQKSIMTVDGVKCVSYYNPVGMVSDNGCFDTIIKKRRN